MKRKRFSIKNLICLIVGMKILEEVYADGPYADCINFEKEKEKIRRG